MPKKLRVKDIDSRGTLTKKELSSWLNSFSDDKPIILKCNGKNYRLSALSTGSVPILIGKRNTLK